MGLRESKDTHQPKETLAFGKDNIGSSCAVPGGERGTWAVVPPNGTANTVQEGQAEMTSRCLNMFGHRDVIASDCWP